MSLDDVSIQKITTNIISKNTKNDKIFVKIKNILIFIKKLLKNCFVSVIMLKALADMVELADTPDLGSGAKACRFKSCYPHHAT